jgi:tetratricopeptide (TPR) repeat protein
MVAKLRVRSDALVYADLGRWFADHKQFGCAAQAFRKAVALQPDSSQYSYLLGLSLYSAGQPNAAIAPLQQSLRLDPGGAAPRLTLGAAFEAAGKRTEAETVWRVALAGDPNSSVALESLSRDLLADNNDAAVITLLRPRAAVGNLPDPLSIDLSVAYSKSGLLEDASDLLHKTLRSHPSSLPVAEALAGVMILQSRFQEALAVLSPVVRQHPADTPTQILYLRTLVLAHDPGAETFGKHLLTKNAQQWEVLYLMGLMREEADDYTGAKDYLAQSIVRNPAYADAHYRLGVAWNALKNGAVAKEQLEKAIALGLDAPEVHFELAKALRSQGEDGAAQQQLKLYQQRLQVQERRAQAAAKAQQGDQAEASGNLQQAAEDYREALALDPAEAVLAYKLAMALDKSGDRAVEQTALEDAIRINPRMTLALNQLGYLDSRDGNTESAIQHFQLAVQADPGYTTAWLNLAATLCLESRWGEARSAISHVLELDPANAAAKALLQRIEEIETQH